MYIKYVNISSNIELFNDIFNIFNPDFLLIIDNN